MNQKSQKDPKSILILTMKLLLTYFWKRLPIGDLISLTPILLAFSKSSQIGPSSSNHLKTAQPKNKHGGSSSRQKRPHLWWQRVPIPTGDLVAPPTVGLHTDGSCRVCLSTVPVAVSPSAHSLRGACQNGRFLFVAAAAACLSPERFGCHEVAGTTRCVEQKYVCDGENHCWDKVMGADEEMCSE